MVGWDSHVGGWMSRHLCVQGHPDTCPEWLVGLNLVKYLGQIQICS